MSHFVATTAPQSIVIPLGYPWTPGVGFSTVIANERSEFGVLPLIKEDIFARLDPLRKTISVIQHLTPHARVSGIIPRFSGDIKPAASPGSIVLT